MAPPTHYEVLGVGRSATIEELRAAFRAAARQDHPDAGGDPERMRQVNAAWQVLGDPSRRAAYDRALAAGHGNGSGTGGTGATGPFGHPGGSGAAGPPGPQWAPDIEGLDLSAEDWAELADDGPLRQTMALEGWWAILPPGTLAAAVVTGCAGVYFMSPPVVALAVGLFVFALGLFVLAPLRAMARRPDPEPPRPPEGGRPSGGNGASSAGAPGDGVATEAGPAAGARGDGEGHHEGDRRGDDGGPGEGGPRAGR